MTKSDKSRQSAARSIRRQPSSPGDEAQLMTGGMAIVSQLIANGVDTVFGLPGAQMYPFFDALQQRSDAIRTVGARHEQGCAYMAFGYARSTGKPGVCSVVPGPGLLNATAALATAMGTCSPVLCVTGQVPSQYIGRGRGHLHELPDQLATIRSLVKWAHRIERPADAPAIVNEAFRQMLTGRPGVVCIEMAWDLMGVTESVRALPAAAIERAHPPSAAAVEAAAKLLVAARHPMIFTGSGAQDASDEVAALAAELDAPVVGFRGGRGIVPNDDPLGFTCADAMKYWPSCDAAVGIGTRMELPYMRWSGMMALLDRPTAPPWVIRIDVDPAEMARLIPHAPILADAAAGATALRNAVRKLRGKISTAAQDSATRRKEIAAVRDETARAIQKIQPQLGYLEAIRDVLPRDGLLVEELCQVGFASAYGFPIYEPRTYVSCGFQGTLGFGFPTALGVKVAHPDTPVVSIIGDGGFMFGVQEMATAVQESIALVTVLFNNESFGNVMRDQKTRFGNRVIGAVLQNPDFQMLARSFGMHSARVTTPDELRKALKTAIAARKPALIEVMVPQGSESSPWEFIGRV